MVGAIGEDLESIAMTRHDTVDMEQGKMKQNFSDVDDPNLECRR